ncbi:MAG TPA: cytochrome c3 family protein [Planctomycetota bacterium]|nr:cytochrome c3 family protein [Planctomycetota bacterium]
MLRRIPAALALLALLGLAASTAPRQEPLQKPFRHEDHVSKNWPDPQGGGEVLRDCRGCHDSSAADGETKFDKPTDRCANCHDPHGYWKENGLTILTAGSRVDPADEAKRLFKHRQHQLARDGKPLACAYCHSDKKEDGTFEIRAPSDFLENKAYCTSCHDNEKPAAEWTADEHAKREFFNAGLDKDAETRAKHGSNSKPPVFSHAAHLSAAEAAGSDPAKCVRCHASLKDARSGSLAETQFDTQACGSCHTGLTFAASDKTAQGQPFQVRSPTAGVFSHAQHLGQGAGKPGVDPIGPRGCLRCHEFEASAEIRVEDRVRSFRLKPFLARPDGKAFQGCVECHHDVKIEDHGNVDACADCHVVEPASLTAKSAMQSNRPLDITARADPASFTFPRQSHKFIAKGRTEDAPESCADCHKAKLEDQPSRIDGLPFNHATHLGMKALAEDGASKSECGRCHTSIATSHSLKDLLANHDLGACTECHGRTAPVATLEAAPRKQVFRFDHEKHVGKNGVDGRQLACGTCHASLDANGEARIGLASKVAECTLCHGHPEKADTRVNRFSKATVDACRACHAAGVPVKGIPVPVGRARLVVADAGWQKHEGEASCSTCHVVPKNPFEGSARRPAKLEPIEVALRTVKAVGGKLPSPHDAERAQRLLPDATPEQRATVQYFYDEVSCIDCHFNSVRGNLVNNAFVLSARDGKQTHPRVKKIFSDPQWRDHYRKLEGDNLDGGADYPGGYPGIAPKRKR